MFPHLLMLEASAGSGKTHALSRRYVWLLLADGVPHNRLSNLLAVTFTKNAAREMKERILGWLKSLALDADPEMMAEMGELLGLKPSEISARARAMADEVIEHYSDFQVQTIDSFTNRLAKASARELGFRPDFETTTSNQALIDYALALLAAGVGPGRDPELTAVMDRFLELLNRGSKSFAWDPQGRMREAFEELLKIEAKETGSFVFLDQTQNITRLLGELARVHQEVVDYAVASGLAFRGKENLMEALAAGDIAKILSWKCYKDGDTPIVKSREDKKLQGLVGPSKKIWAQSGSIVAELAAAWASAQTAPFQLPYGRFQLHLAEAKERLGVTPIDDIAKSLSSHLDGNVIPEVYLKLGARIRHFMVDEFQDTDPAQWRSLAPLMEEALAQDGSAFLVGDLKQAIYMFRQADYRIMKSLKEEIESRKSGRWLPASVSGRARIEGLDKNYRCGQAIVDYVDRTFRQVLPQLIAEEVFGSDRTGLTTYVQEPSQSNLGRGFVQVRCFQKPARGAEEEGETEEQSGGPVRQALLEIIQDAHGRGYAYRDMAVLARTNWELEQAIDWLTQAGIPATSSSGLDIRRRRVVAELLALLRWLDSPVDNAAWAGLVRGRMMLRAAQACGLDWDEPKAAALLFTAGQRAGKHGYLYQECRREAGFARLWDRFLEELYNLSGYAPAYDLACLAVERFRAMQNFPEEAAALLHFLEAVNRIESEGAATLAEILDRAGEQEGELWGLELPENMDAVQLLTFFKAKGMGFPVVINLFSDFKPKGKRLYHSRAGDGIALYAIDNDIARHTEGRDLDLAAIRDERLADEQVQELNSLYVACTRAQDELYNLVSYSPPTKTGDVSGYFRLFPEYQDGLKGRGRGGGTSVPATIPQSAYAGASPRWRPEQAWTRERYAEAVLGEYLHQVLQDIEYLPQDLGAKIEESLQRHRHLAPAVDLKDAAKRLESFLTNPKIACWFSPAPGRYVEREAEFIDQSGRLLRMDRVVHDGGGITVLDFKTGMGSDETLDGHTRQMRNYLAALSQAFPEKTLVGLVCYIDGTVAEVKP